MSHSVKPKASLLSEQLGSWRRYKNSLTNFSITTGGLSVLCAILLIFFYLLYEIMPLFASAELEQQASYTLPVADQSEVIYFGMEEQAEVAVQFQRSGAVHFFAADSGEILLHEQLPVKAEAYALNSQQRPLLGLASGGEVLLVEPKYRISYPDDQRLITPELSFPYGEQPLAVSDANIQHLALRDSEQQILIVAHTSAGLVAKRWLKQQSFLSDSLVLEEEPIVLPELLMATDWLLIGPNQRWLYLLNRVGQFAVIDLLKSQLVDQGNVLTEGEITEAKLLLGDISLLIATDQGEIAQWFMVRDENEHHLQKIRRFANPEAIAHLQVEHRRKGFLSVDDSGRLALFYSTSARQLLAKNLVAEDHSVKQLAIAPRANALLSQSDTGEVVYWHLHNEHPEISWQALWSRVWYESYGAPEYIWQSSASSNDFEPKYSFAPLAFGTLKAAFYAMLIAAPLALCGAIYTAYFMSPVLRKKIKPMVELMEALPTVVLGFLAGLWLAPFVERHLPGIFSLFLLLPVGVLLFAYVWNRYSSRLPFTVPDGWYALLLLPVVILIGWGCFAVSGLLETTFFNGDMRLWLTQDLGIDFDQRNAMVVGIAMGFAVVPTIFSIAEDAIYSVPKSLSYGSLALGGSPWQTLMGVVIPTASPGIFSALMIGMGRAVGETMIVLMATGNTPIMDANIFEGMRTLAANIAVEVGETEVDSTHYRVLLLAAFVLFLFTFVVNTVAEVVRQRLRRRYGSL